MFWQDTLVTDRTEYQDEEELFIEAAVVPQEDSQENLRQVY